MPAAVLCLLLRVLGRFLMRGRLRMQVDSWLATVDAPAVEERGSGRVHPHGRVTMGDAMRLTGGSRNTLKQHFRALVERGHLDQQGGGRGVWYRMK
jgi:hypothetical protein